MKSFKQQIKMDVYFEKTEIMSSNFTLLKIKGKMILQIKLLLIPIICFRQI